MEYSTPKLEFFVKSGLTIIGEIQRATAFTVSTSPELDSSLENNSSKIIFEAMSMVRI